MSAALDNLYAQMAWATQHNGFEEWMEIDAGSPKHVVGVITQGRGSSSPNQFVTRFRVEYRLGDSLASTTASVPGSFDTGRAKQEHLFALPIYARYMRFVVLAFNGHQSMRGALVVKSCVICHANAVSVQGSISPEACQCPAGGDAQGHGVDTHKDMALPRVYV